MHPYHGLVVFPLQSTSSALLDHSSARVKFRVKSSLEYSCMHTSSCCNRPTVPCCWLHCLLVEYIFYPPGPQFCQGQIFTFTCPPGTKLHTSSLIMVGRWDNTKCPGAGVTAPTPPMAKVYTWNIPAGRQSASLPADIVAAVKEDVYPGVAKQIAWYATCVMGR